jgi:hypothetical protein
MRSICAFSAAVFALSLILPVPLAAQTENERLSRAIVIIKNFVADTCQRPGVTGTRTTIAAKAAIEAETKGLARILATLGGEVGGNAERVNWDGVGQEQLAQAMESGNQCAQRMTEILQPVFLPVPAPTPAPAPAAAPAGVTNLEAAKKGQPQYASRSTYGFLEWEIGIHATPEGCFGGVRARSDWLTQIGLTQAVPHSSECVPVPERPACSYEGTGRDAPLYPVCYWTAENCRSDYAVITKMLTNARSSEQVIRVPCEEVDWAAAAKRHEAYALWLQPTMPGGRRGLKRLHFVYTVQQRTP